MTIEQSDTPRHPIRVVSRRTGLTPVLLRAWEKRYEVVAPSRSEGGQRRYSDEDVHRLGLLRRAVEEGRSISLVAVLSTEELEALVEEDRMGRRGPPLSDPVGIASVLRVLGQARRAVREMKPSWLEGTLARGALAFSVPTLIDDVLIPLLGGIGVSWEEGEIGPAHEHVASAVIRRYLEWLLNTVDPGEDSSVFISATPAGERHELGALLSAVSAAAEGWKTVHLGPDLPSSEIASAAIRLEAKIVALSLLDPALGPTLPREVGRLRESLPRSVRLVVGGPAEILALLRGRLPDTELMTGFQELRESLQPGGAPS